MRVQEQRAGQGRYLLGATPVQRTLNRVWPARQLPPAAASPTSLPYPRLLQVGMVWFFAQAVMSIGVPYALAVLPVHMWR